MKKSGMAVSVAALVSALGTLICCLPFGFFVGLGALSAAVYLQSLRPWLLLMAMGLLGFGYYQVRRGLKCGIRQSRIGVVLLAVATMVVLLVALFPQLVAGLLADLGGNPGQ